MTDTLKDELPKKQTDLEVGYYEGCQSAKVWIASLKDLDSTKNGCEIMLWAQSVDEGENDSDEAEKKGKKHRRQEKEEEVETIYHKLQVKHSGKYSVPQLHLWARMIQCGTHDDYDNPPHVPINTGVPHKPTKSDSFTAAFAGAAEAIAKAFTPQSTQSSPVQCSIASSSGTVGISPGKCTELRMKNLQQLTQLH